MTDLSSTRPAGLPQPRSYNGVNWIGVQTLYLREVRRFWKVGAQTVAGPVVTTLLYMLVFVVALRGTRPPLHGTPFADFVAPGLIMMAMLNNAFANASSSLIQAKVMNTATDFLTPPLSPLELTIGFSLGAATRGLVVGLVTAICVMPFAHLQVANLGAILWFGLLACLIMGMLGVFAGLWAAEIRSAGRGPELRHHADDFPQRHLLSGREPARAVRDHQPFQPLLLSDRRIPGRLHRNGERRGECADRRGHERAADPRHGLDLLAGVPVGLAAEELTAGGVD
jgi:hypothetical protein